MSNNLIHFVAPATNVFGEFGIHFTEYVLSPEPKIINNN